MIHLRLVDPTSERGSVATGPGAHFAGPLQVNQNYLTSQSVYFFTLSYILPARTTNGLDTERIREREPMDLPELNAELEKHHRSSYGWALSCCGRDRVEAEEILQMVYLKILEGKAHFRGESSFKTWLFAVIRNTARSEHRKNLVQKLRFLSDAKRGSDQRYYGEKPEIAIERSEAQSRFQRALQQLPARQRETLHLVYYEEMSVQEAAGVMGISVGAVRSHYGRGKKRLRDLLNKLESDDGFKWRRAENPSVVS